jgi:hypothetical protein
MQKKWVALNRTNRRRKWQSISSHSKLLQNDFVFCDVCCSMNEESAFEKIETCKRSISKENCKMCENAETCKKKLHGRSSCKANGIPSRVG